MTEVRVLGVDLSLTCTGLAHPGDDGGRTTAVKRPAGQVASKGWTELRRLQWMRSQVLNHVDDATKDPTGRGRHMVLVVVEGLAYRSMSPHAMTRAGLYWLILDALDDHPYVDVAVASPASRAKYATGKGNAGKDVVMREVARRFPDFAGGEDEADALVLRAMGMDHLGRPLAVMPATHRAALDAVEWPALEWAANEAVANV